MFAPIITTGLPWSNQYFKLFISHTSQNKSLATNLGDILSKFNISSFIAHNDVAPGEEWELAIKERLRSCDALLAILSSDFHQSNWTDHEIGFVLGQDKLVLSINNGTKPYGFLSRYQAISLADKSFPELCNDVYYTLNRNKLTRRRVAEVTVRKFTESSSFEEARRNMILVEKLDYWDDELSKIVLKGFDENDQLNKEYTVPDRLRNFIDKWENAIPF